MTVMAEKISISVIPFRILLPVVITVILFVGTIFQLILPIQEKRMMADRRIMIRELTATTFPPAASRRTNFWARAPAMSPT